MLVKKSNEKSAKERFLRAREKIARRFARVKSQKAKAIYAYAVEICDKVVERGDFPKSKSWIDVQKSLLGGARTWRHYSRGGCSLISTYDIATRIFPAKKVARIFERGQEIDFCLLQAKVLVAAAGRIHRAM